MPDAAAATAAAAVTAAAAPVSFSAVSPPEQGDAISGLTLAVAGVGPALQPDLPTWQWPAGVGPADAWAAAVAAETGWYVLLSQDCDIVRDASDEPTVWVAPLTLVDIREWRSLRRNGYSSRRWAYPADKFRGVPTDKGLVVDLAWATSVLKGSLTAPGVAAVRPLTGPNKAAFAEWVSARTGRAPFPDDVVTKVLDPCYEVRHALSKSYDRSSGGANATLEARVVASAAAWFAHRDGMLVTVLGQPTGPTLQAAEWFDADGVFRDEDFERGRTKLEAAILRRMNKADPHSGYQLRLVFADLAQVKASEFAKFALLLR